MMPGAANAGTTDGPGLGQLSLTGVGGTVTFQYNPKEIKFTKSQVTETAGTIVMGATAIVTDVKELNFDINDLRMEGKAALKDIKLLFAWLVLDPAPPSPPPPRIGSHRSPPTWGKATPSQTKPAGQNAKAGNQRGKPKVLELKMGTTTFADGTGITSQVILKEVTVTFQRFDTNGDPTRAKIDLKLEMYVPPPKGTNPTSFSPAGGRVHTTSAGDSLQRIAQGTYADPSAWRAIAEANDIDDPLRLRNGRTLFLPFSRARDTE